MMPNMEGLHSNDLPDELTSAANKPSIHAIPVMTCTCLSERGHTAISKGPAANASHSGEQGGHQLDGQAIGSPASNVAVNYTVLPHVRCGTSSAQPRTPPAESWFVCTRNLAILPSTVLRMLLALINN